VKKTSMALFVASLMLPLAFDASAQYSPAPGGTEMRRETQRDNASRAAWQKPQDTMESSKLIGARVKAADGKDIGEIDSLIVAKDGKVTHVVVGKGGIAGVGETKVVVPWADVKLGTNRDRDSVVITMDPSVLDKAPRYERRASGDTSPAASPTTAPKSQEKAR
jgi:sporulation protein YlmC with PRC-barrel domain